MEDFVIAKSIIEQLIKQNVGIIDVGSHYGDFVKYVMGDLENYEAIMIEHLPGQFERISSSFPGAKHFNCAVSTEEKIAELFVPTHAHVCAALYDRPAFDEIPHLNERKKIDVNLQRLDSILTESNFEDSKTPYWYIKIDTEGFELDVIKSMGKYINSKKLVAGQFEYGPCWEERNIKLSDMTNILSNAGFLSYRAVIKDGMLAFQNVKESNDYELTNIFFLKASLFRVQ